VSLDSRRALGGTEAVTTSRRGGVLVITIARRAKRNALNAEVTNGIDAAMNELEDDPGLGCAILTGGTELFSSGADLVDGPGPPTERGGLVGLITRRHVKPLIAAVEGFALGGGMELVLCCDLVVASRTAVFGLPEVRLGVIPAFGGAFRLSRLLPANVAREMLITGENLGAERAERLGFVNVLSEPGSALDDALNLAIRICANAPLAVRAALAMLDEEVKGDETSSWRRNDETHARLLESEDVKEGIAAFFEKRAPTWKDR
jgi:enoyl-CoA hydratase